MKTAQNPPSICNIFLSCVTKEFLPHREMLAKDLNLPHVKVQVQEDFVEGGHSTLEKLDDYIKDCSAVIHLVGSATGSTPASKEVAALLKRYADFSQRIPCLKDGLEANPPEFSYTQWEAWLAIYHNVPCYVYRAEPTTVRATGFVEDMQQRLIQEAHWSRFGEHGKDRKAFRDEQELCRLVLRRPEQHPPFRHAEIERRTEGLAVVRCVGCRLLPRSSARSAQQGWPPRKHPLLETSARRKRR